MQRFTGWQYLLIDVCNQFGLDQMIFEKRILWAEANLGILESLADQADKKPLYLKACQAIRAAQAGKPSGHLVGFDAVSSGLQIMSAVTGCEAGADATGLTNPDVRADAYTLTTNVMNTILGNTLVIERKDAKQALMTAFYGSKLVPKQIFGDGTAEYEAFYQAAKIVAPGPWELLQDLLASWKPMALGHSWKLPDGYDAVVKVMVQKEKRIEVDELDHATFTYVYYENEGTKKGLSIAANIIHSMDGYVLRAMHRRCNYDVAVVNTASDLIGHLLTERHRNNLTAGHDLAKANKVGYYIEQYQRSNIADVVILPYLDETNIHQCPTNHLEKLSNIIRSMVQYQPFPIITIHDEFKCHPNNMNDLRQQYINILADLAESDILSDVLSQVRGYGVKWSKMSTNLGVQIRLGNYALC